MKKTMDLENKSSLEEIIARLIEADENARKLSKAAEDERSETEKSIDGRKAEIRQKYLDKAGERIESMKKKELEDINAAAEKTERQVGVINDRLKKAAEENTEYWVEQIFNRVVSE